MELAGYRQLQGMTVPSSSMRAQLGVICIQAKRTRSILDEAHEMPTLLIAMALSVCMYIADTSSLLKDSAIPRFVRARSNAASESSST